MAYVYEVQITGSVTASPTASKRFQANDFADAVSKVTPARVQAAAQEAGLQNPRVVQIREVSPIDF